MSFETYDGFPHIKNSLNVQIVEKRRLKYLQFLMEKIALWILSSNRKFYCEK